ncbi:Pentatricopeptide repeat-containing protein [Platanthera zijinensis]|uniref:Pentatricopeptide repeat-containing protein n=1 Tax=Platanthera zijinensis TaxID=2320716 RepID=A0AAP0GAM6_9ASPA
MAIAICRRTCPAALRRLFSAQHAPPKSLSATPFRRSSPSSSPSRFSTAPFYKPTTSSHLASSSETDSSDFDTESGEPISNFASPDLPTFLHLLSRAKSEFSTEAEALAFLRSSSLARPAEALLCSVLWELRRDWESTILAFRWCGDCVLESPWSCNLMIWAFGKQRRFDLAWGLLRRMHRKSLPTRQALLILVERYASANETEKAIKTFHALEKFNVEADSAAFYALLRALCKNKNTQEAEELLITKRGFFPLETAGFNIVLDGWCNIFPDETEAKRVWRDMAKYCVAPDATSYTHMIGFFAKLRNLFDSLRLYNEMKRRGWVPSLKVHNCIIYVLTSEGCIKEAFDLLNKIVELGLQPDLKTYNSMILPLCEAHRLDEAQEVMKMMSSGSVRPSVETYHALIKIVDSQGVFELIDRMREDGCRPVANTYLLMFNKFFSMGESGCALRMWSEMRKSDVVPDVVHYTAMIKGLVADGWILKAMDFYGEMKSREFPADPELDKLFKDFLSNSKNHWSRGAKEYITGKHERNRITSALKTGNMGACSYMVFSCCSLYSAILSFIEVYSILKINHVNPDQLILNKLQGGLSRTVNEGSVWGDLFSPVKRS